MKKKIAIIATAAALASLMIVGGTLAWFTSSDEATNVITTGNIQIELRETDPENPDGGKVSTEGFQYDAMPGAQIDKDPMIFNTGNNDAYVRVKVEVAGTGEKYASLTTEEKAVVDGKLALVKNVIATEMTTKNDFMDGNDGYFYYVDVLSAAGADDDSDWVDVFEGFKAPGAEWGNEMSDIQFNITVSAEAIQADNVLGENETLSLDIMKGFGWPTEE